MREMFYCSSLNTGALSIEYFMSQYSMLNFQFSMFKWNWLPVAEADTNRIRSLVQSFFEHAPGCIRTIEFYRAQLQFCYVGDLPGLQVKISAVFILASGTTLEFLA